MSSTDSTTPHRGAMTATVSLFTREELLQFYGVIQTGQRGVRADRPPAVSAAQHRCDYRPIPDVDEAYACSCGFVWRADESGDVTRATFVVNDAGYLYTYVRVRGMKRIRSVHVMVAAAFLGPRPEGMWVRHLDGNKVNPRPYNLTYGTPRENSADRWVHGTVPFGRKHHASVPAEVVRRGLEMRAAGASLREIMRECGVKAPTVVAWIRGDTRPDVSRDGLDLSGKISNGRSDRRRTVVPEHVSGGAA